MRILKGEEIKNKNTAKSIINRLVQGQSIKAGEVDLHHGRLLMGIGRRTMSSFLITTCSMMPAGADMFIGKVEDGCFRQDFHLSWQVLT